MTGFVALPLRAPLVVTSPYGPRGALVLADGTRKPAGHHPGIDLRAALGTPTFAVGAGSVESIENGAAGLIVRLRLDTGERVSYVHLQRADVTRGQRVGAGDRIALTGNSGGVEPHLHLEVRAPGATSGSDPTPYLQRVIDAAAAAPSPAPPSSTTPPKKGGGGTLLAIAALVLFS